MEEIRQQLTAMRGQLDTQSAAQARLEAAQGRIDADLKEVTGGLRELSGELHELGAVLREQAAVERATRKQTEEIQQTPRRLDALEPRIGNLEVQLGALQAQDTALATALADLTKAGTREKFSSAVIELANNNGVRAMVAAFLLALPITAMSCRGTADLNDLEGFVSRAARAWLGISESPALSPAAPKPALPDAPEPADAPELAPLR